MQRKKERNWLLDPPTSIISQMPVRLVYFAFGIAAFLLMYSVGASIPMSYADAQDHVNQFLADTENIDQNGIFLNNTRIALGMFVPVFGAGLGGYAALSTGMMFKAFVTINPDLGNISPLMVLANPFGILEVLAYGLAISRSAMLTFQLIKRRNHWIQFLMLTAIEIALVTAALLVGAAIEGEVISSE